MQYAGGVSHHSWTLSTPTLGPGKTNINPIVECVRHRLRMIKSALGTECNRVPFLILERIRELYSALRLVTILLGTNCTRITLHQVTGSEYTHLVSSTGQTERLNGFSTVCETHKSQGYVARRTPQCRILTRLDCLQHPHTNASRSVPYAYGRALRRRNQPVYQARRCTDVALSVVRQLNVRSDSASVFPGGVQMPQIFSPDGPEMETSAEMAAYE
ncbi:uncharacterized protein CC84DRAFT_242119 [Paraphaeosphaeria sporulosa]|uniref:Uncharacterized protein n=1 Tax=Paraphaeosphaeria sporulosa TaxID=1460663 RepID=A0A177C363_9PLEO|nr:uncharacterized protein CC84DRAFT_242119 [Paraphaeosphaeria sporulosa]OAG01836.1 hypothetical protein CC84DRAFT_242119 [Paraphaeosphaeria sporulosa]